MKFLFLLMIIPSMSFSQDDSRVRDTINTEKVHDNVDQEPQFPWGIDSLSNYIDYQVINSSLTVKPNEQGNVYVKFVVGKEGEITKAFIVSGVSPVADAEAKRIIMGMPNWIPAKLKGENVAANFTIPVRFEVPEVQANYAENDEIIDIEEDEFEEAPDPLEDHLYFGDDELEPEFPSENNLISWEESDPSFPGGQQAMIQYIDENLDYPKVDLISGTVYVQFLVDTLGFIHDIEIRRGLSDSLDAAVVKMVSAMPQWIPGTFRNKPIAAKMTLPVRFDVEE